MAEKRNLPKFIKRGVDAIRATTSDSTAKGKALESKKKKNYGVGGKFGHKLDQKKHELDYDEVHTS